MTTPGAAPASAGPGLAAGALDGVVVLDLTRFLSGPQCTLLLAGLGAEVIKIDDPATGDPTVKAPPMVGPQGVGFARRSPADYGIAYLKRARGKQSVTLDLKHADGLALFMTLVERADVVVENFRVGVAERLGIDWPRLQARNPRLVHCALTGYGSSGPDSGLKAYDLMVQAASGLMSITGPQQGAPVKAGSPLSDTIAGAYAALGIVAALKRRDRTGRGQSVDVSMADCLMSMMLDEPLDCYAQLGLDARQGNRIMRFSPFNTYAARDGWIAIGAATDAEWLGLLDAMGRSDLRAHPDWSRVGWRIEHNAQVDALVGDWVATQSRAELQQALTGRDVPCSPVRTIDDVLQWPQARARGLLQTLRLPDGAATDVLAPGFPLKFSESAAGFATPAPVPGGDTQAVLSRLAGVDAERLAQLRASGVI